jgi:hypothetical protein
LPKHYQYIYCRLFDAEIQNDNTHDVKVHTDIKVEAGMSHLTKLFLAGKKSGKSLFGRHQFMVTVGPRAVATVSDREGVFELLIPNSTRYDVLYKKMTTWEKLTCY